ncbi:MAG: zinc-ribbon domain-containing protein [Desulfobacterales bacterium]|jgi:HAMP domain-containing protein/DNA-directed RNA polymerase subunit RPC12/RpoP
MIIICEECGRKYHLDPTLIRNDEVWITCKTCRHRFTVQKPKPIRLEPVEEEMGDLLDFVPVEEVDIEDGEGAHTQVFDTAVQEVAEEATGKKNHLGLTAKFMLFVLVPFVLIYAASSYYSLYKMKQMHQLTLSETSDIIWGIAKRSLRDKAESVAVQTRQYLYSHPDLKNSAFNRDIYFKKIAIQKMGLTGETFIYELPGPDGIWRAWAHGDARLVGIDLGSLQQSLGTRFDDFWNILTGVKDGKPSEGFYRWMTGSDKEVEKYMVSVPVSGTPYVVAAVTDTDEFVRPIDLIESKAAQLSDQTRKANAIALLAGFLILGAVIFLYGRSLTARIRHLSDVADRICIGELDAEIRSSVHDELGELSNAIARMRDSIKVSIDRLRRRRRSA